MIKKIRVLQFGVGAVGRETIRQLAMRGIDLVGAVDENPALTGQDVGLVADLGRELGIRIERDLEHCLQETQPDVVLHATGFVPELVLRDFSLIARHHAHVVSISGIAYIWKRYPDLAKSLHQVALQHKVAFVGAGMIPGFLSDLLPIVLSGACHEVRSIAIRRCADYSPWGPDVMARYGFGLKKEEFERQVATGRITLFASLWQSLDMMVHALGWDIVEEKEEKSPWISTRNRQGSNVRIAPREVCGFRHQVSAENAAGQTISIEVQGYIQPEGEEEQPQLSVRIDGGPSCEMIINGELVSAQGSLMTSSARMINALPRIMQAEPGLASLSDLPIMSAYRAV